MGRYGPAAILSLCAPLLLSASTLQPAQGTDDSLRSSIAVNAVGELPALRVMRTARLTVRVVNNGYEVLPGGSAEDFNRGRPAVFVGAWFAPARPRGLGTFEQTLKIEVPIPPGRSVDVTLEVKPSRPGKQYLGLGLFRSAVSGKDTGQVGDVTVLPVTVARGSWIDNHRPLFLRTLIGVHIVGFAVSLLLLYLWTHSQ